MDAASGPDAGEALGGHAQYRGGVGEEVVEGEALFFAHVFEFANFDIVVPFGLIVDGVQAGGGATAGLLVVAEP